MQAIKSGSKIPLGPQIVILVRSNYIPHTFNPCGDVTMSYLLWEEAEDYLGSGKLSEDMARNRGTFPVQ